MLSREVTLVMRRFAGGRGLDGRRLFPPPIALHSPKGIRLTAYEGPPQIYTVRLS